MIVAIGSLYRLIFFLHGSGEGEGKFCKGKTVSGAEYDLGLNTVDSICYHGLPHKIDERSMSADFVVVSPQAPAAAGASWSDADGVAIDALEDLAAAITEALAVDLERVYLTGLSMGGAGTWCATTRLCRIVHSTMRRWLIDPIAN